MSTPPETVGDNVLLIGPMGAGKSSVARELTRLTKRRWADTDRIVAQHTGQTISQVFAAHGEAGFRRLETEALESLSTRTGMIIATGGGIVTQPRNLPLLRALGCVVFLTADEDVLFTRVSRNRQRPLLQTADPGATLRELVRWRRPLYEECAHCTVDTSVGTHADIAGKVLAQARRFFADAAAPSPVP